MKLIEDEKRLAVPSRLIIFGIGKIRGTKIKRMIDEFGLSDRIIFTGFVSDEEKRALLEKLLLLPFSKSFRRFRNATS
jgi:glycosyltransferase involved in cell wall biosynthesis